MYRCMKCEEEAGQVYGVFEYTEENILLKGWMCDECWEKYVNEGAAKKRGRPLGSKTKKLSSTGFPSARSRTSWKP